MWNDVCKFPWVLTSTRNDMTWDEAIERCWCSGYWSKLCGPNLWSWTLPRLSGIQRDQRASWNIMIVTDSAPKRFPLLAFPFKESPSDLGWGDQGYNVLRIYELQNTALSAGHQEIHMEIWPRYLNRVPQRKRNGTEQDNVLLDDRIMMSIDAVYHFFHGKIIHKVAICELATLEVYIWQCPESKAMDFKAPISESKHGTFHLQIPISEPTD